jgi:hypothetical protein
MKKKAIITIFLAIAAITTSNAQCQYCNTYEDFLAGRWQQLDTIYCDSHSKTRQIFWGGNDYTLSTGDKAIDKILKKDAFVVRQADTLYVNCRNLQYEKTRFGNGYTKAMRIGQRSLLFVNRIIGIDARNSATMSGLMFGALGGAITASQQVKQQVCYVISYGADNEGRIAIRLIDDGLMDQMIANRDDLHDEYYAEENTTKRLLAKHIIPILEKAGLFEQAK